MKKINIICVGKLKKDYLKQGIDDYSTRLKKYCAFKIIELNDYKDSSTSIDKESESILKALQTMQGFNILLDLNGKAIDSNALSNLLEDSFLKVGDTVNFIIGGSNGVNLTVKSKCDVLLNFGKMTMPHGLIRLVLTEQIYRALSISAGSPYHK